MRWTTGNPRRLACHSANLVWGKVQRTESLGEGLGRELGHPSDPNESLSSSDDDVTNRRLRGRDHANDVEPALVESTFVRDYAFCLLASFQSMRRSVDVTSTSSKARVACWVPMKVNVSDYGLHEQVQQHPFGPCLERPASETKIDDCCQVVQEVVQESESIRNH